MDVENMEYGSGARRCKLSHGSKSIIKYPPEDRVPDTLTLYFMFRFF